MSNTNTSPEKESMDSTTVEDKNTITAIDLFCGAGGFSHALHQIADELNVKLQEAAVNHWDRAIETHEENNPDAVQYHSKVEQLHPPNVIEEVTGEKDADVDILVAGPECTHYSRARGDKPVTEQKRMSPWHILDWLEKCQVENFCVENVPEIQDWGPVDEDGQPVQDGSVFSAWVNALNSLGYAVDWTELNAKNYGDPTSRNRFFIVGTKTGKATFPDPKYSNTDDELPDCKTAADVINWDNLGKCIWTRDVRKPRVNSPPAETTLKRIGEGIKRHCSDQLKPFAETIKSFDRDTIESIRSNRIVPQKYARTFAQTADAPFFVKTDSTPPTGTILLRQQDGAHPIDVTSRSVPTIATGGGHSIVSMSPTSLIEPKNGKNGGDYSNLPYNPRERPLNTLTTAPQLHLLTPYLTPLYNSRETQAPRTRSVDRPVMTIPASKSPAAVNTPVIRRFSDSHQTSDSVEADESTIDSLNENEELSLCIPEMWPLGLSIKYRMLQPDELKKAQGFADDYNIKGTKTERKRQIGNAVPVNLAGALCKHVLTEQKPSLSSFGGGVREDETGTIPDYEDVISSAD